MSGTTDNPSINIQEFPNGLVLLAEEMNWVESAAFTIRVPAGTIHEPEEYLGLGSFTCEMILRGAGSRDSRAIINDLDNLGVDSGESVSDAHTSFNGATMARNLLPALEIYADLLRRPHLPQEQLEAGRLVCLQELAGVEDEPGQKVMQELRRLHYPWPWGRNSQGSRSGLEGIGQQQVREFFDKFYQPRGTVVAVAGKIDWPRLRDQVGRLLGDWSGEESNPPAEYSRGARIAHLNHESNQTQIAIGYESIPYNHPDYFQAWGAVGVLSGGMSSRLFTEVREKRGLCYSIHASLHSLKDRGSVFCHAGTSAERAQQTLDVTMGELLRLSKGIEQSELDRLKARIKSALIMQQESSGARSASIAREWYHLGRVRSLEEIESMVDALTCESINKFLVENPPRDFTIVTLGPKALEVPSGIS